MTTDYLDDSIATQEPATKGQRFANYLIDLFVVYLLIFALAIVLALVMPSMMESLTNEENSTTNLIFYIVFAAALVLFYTLMEGLSRGKSLGKLITRTRAVNEDGSAITMATAFKRSLSRMVPFEAFSAFGTAPWHDRWTDTVVIKEQRQ